MRHARDSTKLLEVASDELRPIVGDDSRPRFWVLFLGAFEDYFDISFPHGLPQISMHEETTEPVQNAAQVIEGAGGWPTLTLRAVPHPSWLCLGGVVL